METAAERWKLSRLWIAFWVVLAAIGFALSCLAWQMDLAFRADSHVVPARVVSSDCWDFCRGGPSVWVEFATVDGRNREESLDNVDRHYEVGDRLDIAYSEDRRSLADASTVPPDYSGSAWRWGLFGAGSLTVLLASWAFTANLRRLDRLDAEKAHAAQGPG